jgi:hypothetical protein
MTTDLHADYIAAQAAGHHPDCDGFRTAHRVTATPAVNAGHSATCADCGELGGWFATPAAVVAAHRGHAQDVRCDGRCRSWS